MRCLLNSVAVLMFSSLATAQVPAMDRARTALPPACVQDTSLDSASLELLAPAYAEGTSSLALPPGHVQQFKGMVGKGINQALMSENSPSLETWRPLTPQEKFHTFVASFYSLGAHAGAGVDAVTEKFVFNDRGYQTGWTGLGQYYAVMLVNSEVDVFFKGFLLPTLLQQDPRYYRNPSLSFSQRFLYSTSRVFVARADHGGQMFNGSMVLGSAARQALKDLYVPDERQGIGAIGSRVAFDLLREAGSNLMHEFWPDLRRRFFHR